MPSESNEKGKSFKEEVEDLLEAIRKQHPQRMKVNKQLSLMLYDGQEVKLTSRSNTTCPRVRPAI